MELRDFAEQVLFATTLEEKLRPVDAVSDERPGAAIIPPTAPGRPAELRFKGREAGREFPGLSALEREHERGRLLHFFANHELLATELMALVLLRFPDAPAAFRRGVFQTLRDEQEHTRLYMERMEACGVRFGELPVSGYFWRAVSPMESPMDYVAGLSLTFEQANLDFARHFAGAFRQVGDKPAAQLLERIYRDEIAHVAAGLKWFRRWKNPDESDWEAFCRQLKFPLSPQRAKGFTLNVAGRRAAGLDADFIARLDVFAQSKGRTPQVLVFNPFAEGWIAGGPGFTPVRAQQELAEDLATLPMFLGRQDDIVLVPRRPGMEFLSGLKQAGFPLPEFVELTPGSRAADTALAGRKLGGLRPWAWGPDSVKLLAPLVPQVTGDRRAVEECFNERIARLYSKAWSAGFLTELLAAAEPAPWLVSAQEAGVAVTSVEGALEAVAAIRRRGHHRVVIKQALGLAGQNALRLWEPEVSVSQRRWMAGACARGITLIVEPWLERVLDFSVQLEMTAAGLKLCGYTGLLNDARGQFQGNWAAPNHTRRLPDALVNLFPSPPDVALRLHQLMERLRALLETRLGAAGFRGPVGVDALVCRDATGACRVKPVVEINPRYTMGRLTVELMKFTCPGSFGCFRLHNRAGLARSGLKTLAELAAELSRRHPVEMEGSPAPRLRRGVVCLNEPARARSVLAVFHASPDWRELFEPGPTNAA